MTPTFTRAIAAAKQLSHRVDRINRAVLCLFATFLLGVFGSATSSYDHHWRSGVEREGVAATATVTATHRSRYSRTADIVWQDGGKPRVARVTLSSPFFDDLRARERRTLPIIYRGDDVVVRDDNKLLMHRHPIAPGLALALLSLIGMLLVILWTRRPAALRRAQRGRVRLTPPSA